MRNNGTAETRAEGACHVEWRERGKGCRVSDACEDAVAQAGKKAVELQTIRYALIAIPQPEVTNAKIKKTATGEAIDAYL